MGWLGQSGSIQNGIVSRSKNNLMRVVLEFFKAKHGFLTK
jgi:hypothetical protein